MWQSSRAVSVNVNLPRLENYARHHRRTQNPKPRQRDIIDGQNGEQPKLEPLAGERRGATRKLDFTHVRQLARGLVKVKRLPVKG